MDYKEKILTDISAALTSSGCSGEEARKIVYIITGSFEDYEVKPIETGLAIPENQSEQLLKLYKGTLLTEGRSEKTVEIYVKTIYRFYNDIQKKLTEVNSFDIRLWLAKIQQTASQRTCENYRLYLSCFYSWLVNEEIIDKNPVSKIKPVKYLKEEKKSFTSTEIDALKSSCENEKQRAMVELLLSSGVRVEELSNLNRDDIDFNTLEVRVRNGKGKKERTTYMNEVCAMYLKKYLETRSDSDDFLFASQKKQRISTGTVRLDLHNLGDLAGVSNVHPHRFRRTFATTMHNRGMDLRTIQLLMGHANINTTTQYIASDKVRVQNEYKRHA